MQIIKTLLLLLFSLQAVQGREYQYLVDQISQLCEIVQENPQSQDEVSQSSYHIKKDVRVATEYEIHDHQSAATLLDEIKILNLVRDNYHFQNTDASFCYIKNYITAQDGDLGDKFTAVLFLHQYAGNLDDVLRMGHEYAKEIFWKIDVIIGALRDVKRLLEKGYIYTNINPINFAFIKPNDQVAYNPILINLHNAIELKDFKFRKLSDNILHIAPETINERKFGEKSVVYQFGFFMYEIFNTFIHDRLNNSDIISCSNISMKGLLNHFYCLEFEQLVLSMLQEDPNQRPKLSNVLSVMENSRFTVENNLHQQKVAVKASIVKDTQKKRTTSGFMNCMTCGSKQKKYDNRIEENQNTEKLMPMSLNQYYDNKMEYMKNTYGEQCPILVNFTKEYSAFKDLYQQRITLQLQPGTVVRKLTIQQQMLI